MFKPYIRESWEIFRRIERRRTFPSNYSLDYDFIGGIEKTEYLFIFFKYKLIAILIKDKNRFEISTSKEFDTQLKDLLNWGVKNNKLRNAISSKKIFDAGKRRRQNAIILGKVKFTLDCLNFQRSILVGFPIFKDLRIAFEVKNYKNDLTISHNSKEYVARCWEEINKKEQIDKKITNEITIRNYGKYSTFVVESSGLIIRCILKN